MRRVLMIFTALLASGVAGFGYTNVLENGASQTITNGWDAVGDMVVGGATPSNTLNIVGGGALTNINAFVGATAGASNNTATVSGSGAEWINTGTLQVGAAGNSNNSVSVSSGGIVDASNLVLVAGNGFNLNNKGTLSLSEGLDVSQAGFNWNTGGILSVGGELTGLVSTNAGTFLSGEKTLVLEGGSLATSTNLIVGYESSGNTLAITNGGTVSNANGYIGWGADSANNSVLVSDSGSAWTNNGNLYVGAYGTNLLAAGAGNSLTVTNDAWVFVGGLDTNLPIAGGGIAVADGAEMVVGESARVLADGVYVSTNGNLNLDGTLAVNHAFDADQTGFHWNDGATLVVHGNLTMAADLAGTNRTLNVDGGSWNRGGDLTIAGTGNTLKILNGGGVTNDDAYVVGSNNTVAVSGDGSDWLNNGSLNITNVGNSVAVDSGGRVTADSLNIAVENNFNLNNGGTLAMTGGFDLSEQTNLNWNSGGNLSVAGSLEGMAVATNLPMADAAYLSDGKVLTLDGGHWLAGDSNLVVGLNNDLNQLVITNGGTVDNADGYIGWGASGDLNSVVVGTGSAWTNHGGGLYVGKYLDAGTNLVDSGSDNTLAVQDGGWVFVGEGRTNGLGGGLVVASTNGAELVVGGQGSSVDVAQTLYIGTDSNTAGSVVVEAGGSVSAGGLSIATNSTFELYGTFAATTNFDAGMDGFAWHDGATLSVGGTLDGLDALGGSNRTLAIDGGTWDTTATNLYITGVGNTLSITNGGSVDSASAYIGLTSNDVDNTVLVAGNGSEWSLSGDLFVNPSNTLALASTGLVSVAGNMSVSNATVAGSGTVAFSGSASQLSIYGSIGQLSPNVLFDGGGGADTAVALTDSELIVAGSLTNRFVGFENLNMTNSLLGGNGAVDTFGNIGLSGGRIAPDGELVIDGTFSASDTLLQLTVGESSLVFTNSGGPQNLSGLQAEITVPDTNAFSGTILTADGGFSGNFSSTNFIEHFLLYDFQLTSDGTSVSVESEAAQNGEIGAQIDYASVQGIRAGFNGMVNAAFVRTRQLRRNTVATDHAISNEAYLLSSTNAPAGPQGPGDQNTVFGMHFWAQQFSGQGDYDAMGKSAGFKLNNNGTSFGFDRLFGDSLVVGGNYTYARTAAKSTTTDRVDTETYWLGLYGEWHKPSGYYLDGLLAFGWSDYDTLRTDGTYQGIGKFSGNDLGGHLEAGKYFHTRHWAVAPYAGLGYLSVKSDDYAETDPGGPTVSVQGQDVASFESTLGIKLRNRFDTKAGRFQTISYAEWVYDFINDEIGSALSDGTVSVETARVAPGENLFNAGLGLAWICTDYLEVGLAYDGRFNENYEEHTGSFMLDIRF